MKKINNIIQKIFTSKYIGYILIFFLSCIIIAPIFSMDLTQNNEARLHMARIFSINSVLKDGVFPPIIDYKYINGFGYALNLFYGPITTYIPIIFLNLLGTSGLALKVFAFFTVFLSGITMYNFIYSVTKRRLVATIGAIIYISVPYKLSNIFSRSAVGEYTAFIFIPLVFEGLYNIFNDKGKSYLLGIGIIGLILSHTISTVYIVIFAFIYLLLNINKLGKWKVWKKLLLNAFVALVVCMFYLIPLIEHYIVGNYTIFDNMAMHSNCPEVYTTTLGFEDLFASEFGNQEIRFSLGIMTCILVLLGVFCYKKIKKEYKEIYLSFLFISIIALIMATKLFPWFLMPSFMGVIQFAWRNLGFFAFFISLICGINAVTFAEGILKKEVLKDTVSFAVIISICVFASLGVMRDWKFGDLENEKKFDDRIRNTDRVYFFSINRDYLPLNSLKNQYYLVDRDNCTYVLDGKATIDSENKVKLKDIVQLSNVEDNTIIELPYIYYLGYDVEVKYDNNDYVNVKTFESENGMVAIELEQCESATVNIEYKGTIIEKVGYGISFVGVIMLIAMIYVERRNNLLYENEREI